MSNPRIVQSLAAKALVMGLWFGEMAITHQSPRTSPHSGAG